MSSTRIVHLTDTDDYIRSLEEDGGQAIWQAKLSDGSVVTQDDNRPELEPRSAWLRLAIYLRESGPKLFITDFWLRFRSRVMRGMLPTNADGYYFCKSLIGVMQSRKMHQLYLMGAMVGEKLVVQKWRVPHLILIDAQERDPETSGFCLIRRA